MMIKRSIQVSALIGLLLITGCDRSNVPPVSDDPLVGKLYRDRSLFVYSYDKAFAKRFSLPLEKALVLGSGLKAIAIEARPTLGTIKCYVHLYLDDSITPYLPGNNEAGYVDMQFVEWIFSNKFTDEDKKWRWATFTQNRAVYMEKSETGFMMTRGFKQYKHHFLPNLSLLTFNVFCSKLGSKNMPAELVFQKSGTEEYVLGHDDPNNMHNKNTYYFDIPPKLQQHFDRYARFIDDYNFSPEVNDKIDILKPTIEYP